MKLEEEMIRMRLVVEHVEWWWWWWWCVLHSIVIKRNTCSVKVLQEPCERLGIYNSPRALASA